MYANVPRAQFNSTSRSICGYLANFNLVPNVSSVTINQWSYKMGAAKTHPRTKQAFPPPPPHPRSPQNSVPRKTGGQQDQHDLHACYFPARATRRTIHCTVR